MRFLLFFFLFPYISGDLVSNIFQSLLPPEKPTGNCRKFDVFVFSLLKQCPAILDTCCLSRFLQEIDYRTSLTCSLVGSFPNNSLHLLSSKEFLKLVSMRDSCGRPWCMVSLMYSRSCIFSAKVADRYGELAHIYPQLLITAVDVSNKDSSTDTLINHYGVAATPVIVLWENGLPRYKVTEEPGKFDSLVNVLQKKTNVRPSKNWTADACVDSDCELTMDNLVPVNKSNVLRQSFVIDEELQNFDWYLLVTVIALILQLLYIFEARRQDGIPWKDAEFGF